MNVTQDKLRKVILKGKHMDNYFPNQSYLDRCFEGMDTKTVQRNTSYCSSGTSSEKIKNNWVKHMMKYIQDIQTDVQIQEFLNNTEYDELLTRNIVFIHLVDGSAINTLLECFVRNTPILVNRHPAVVEVLGESYPLYYDDPETVHELLASPTAIYDAHVYLTQQDKTPYSMDAFMTQLNKIYGIVSKI